MGGSSCLAGDVMGVRSADGGSGYVRNDGCDWQVGDRVVFDDMIHYTMVKTTMFNGVRHPSIAILATDGTLRTIRQFNYDDYKTRMG